MSDFGGRSDRMSSASRDPNEAPAKHDDDFWPGWPAFLYPEVHFFTLFVVMSPVWAVRHVHRGEYWQAVVILLVSIPAVVGFVWFLRKGRRWSAYLTIVALILLAFLLTSVGIVS